MKTFQLFTVMLLNFLILVSCTDAKNSTDFIKKTKGRYFFNADEIIEVDFLDKNMIVRWRNQELEPLKINDSTFYVKELNEKLIFQETSGNILLASKKEHHDKIFIFEKVKKGIRTPSEYLANGEFEQALQGYLEIQRRDSLSPIIGRRNINDLGYKQLRKNNIQRAIEIFKINIALYPNHSNSYDSLGDAYLKDGDTINARIYYKKSLIINPENTYSKRKLERISE